MRLCAIGIHVCYYPSSQKADSIVSLLIATKSFKSILSQYQHFKKEQRYQMVNSNSFHSKTFKTYFFWNPQIYTNMYKFKVACCLKAFCEFIKCICSGLLKLKISNSSEDLSLDFHGQRISYIQILKDMASIYHYINH